MTLTPLHRLTIGEASGLIKCGELSPLELTESFLKRIEEFDPQLKAYLTVTADLAICQAKLAEAEIASGKYRGPLHGITIALKDLFDTVETATKQ